MQHKVEVKRGDDCWIAVAKGAIIKSLGVYTKPPLVVKSCPRHYGIKVRKQYASYENHEQKDLDVDPDGKEWALDQLRWYVQKGDGLFPGKPLVATYNCSFSMKASEYDRIRGKGRSQGLSSVTREIVFIASSRDQPPMRLDAVDQGMATNPPFPCPSLLTAP